MGPSNSGAVSPASYCTKLDQRAKTQREVAAQQQVMSMLVDPNVDSPANIDAAVTMKNDYDGWKKKAQLGLGIEIEAVL